MCQHREGRGSIRAGSAARKNCVCLEHLMMKRWFGLAGLLLSFALAAPAQAQSPAKLPYPQKLVTLVTHSSPGSGSDVVLREMIKYLERYMATRFIVENDEGGSGAKAMARVA